MSPHPPNTHTHIHTIKIFIPIIIINIVKDKCKSKAYSMLFKASIQLDISQHFLRTVNGYTNYKSVNLDISYSSILPTRTSYVLLKIKNHSIYVILLIC